MSSAAKKTSRAERPAKSEGRVRLDVDTRREQLLSLGLTVFGENTYESISIDDIAARAGISKGLLYHYFQSKRGFYVAVVRHAARELLDHLQPDRSLPPEERARRGVESYFTYVEGRAPAFLALLRSGVGTDTEVFQILEETRVEILGLLVEGLGGGEVDPLLRVGLRAWIGAVEAASLEWLEKRDTDREALVDLLMQLLVHTVTSALQIKPKGIVGAIGVVAQEAQKRLRRALFRRS